MSLATGGDATDTPAQQSPFARAVEEYINSRPKKSKTPEFIRSLQNQQRAGEPLDKNAVKQAIIQLEREATDRAVVRNVRKVLNPVVSVLTTYAGVVDTLAQADPMPTALIWGSLKAVIQCSSRFLEVYDKIKDQITNLSTHIEVLTEYEELFGDSSTMQELLQASYIDILRFWRRVEKECKRCVANRMTRAVASFSTTKLDEIILGIEKNAERMTLLVPAVQERLARGERENAAEERRLAGLARDEQAAFFELQAQELKLRNEERKANRKQYLGTWLLGGASQLNESNHRHQEQHVRVRNPGTCTWLSKNEIFSQWIRPDSAISNLWLKAPPGVGKSVLTAYAVEEVQKASPDAGATCFHYYSFDEEFTALQVFRFIAEQLKNRLWDQTEDLPEDIYSFAQRSTTSSKTEDVKTVIRMLLDQMTVTYIFLDGLDEECDGGSRWNQLTQVVDFFLDLGKKDVPRVKIWCSSQERSCMDSRLKDFSAIQVTHSSNKEDIERYLSDKIPQLDDLELDPGYKTLVLEDLSSRADGCFLWASLMLDSITSAESLQAIQEQINEGLPQTYESYYMRKLERTDPSKRKFVCILLACIVYARRPLRLDELCEATAAVGTEDCRDIDRSRKLFKKTVISLCQPLVRVQETETKSGPVSICTLTHATVRRFLLKHTNVLSGGSGSEKIAITNQVMADVCLKYLWQPRYSVLLKKSDGAFLDGCGNDVLEHHLLPYAAKYWDKHLDDVEYSDHICERVVRFIKSQQYYTTLQVQSLFVGGQFQFWWNTYQMSAGPHIKRVYPAWLGPHCDESLENDYRLFVSDWGYVLNEKTSLKGPYSGEIDRCFFQTLGPSSFLSRGPSRYNSFTLMDRNERENKELPARYFDAIDELGTTMIVLILPELHKDSETLEFICQHWSLDGQTHKLQRSQTLTTSSSSNWALYDYPVSEKTVGRSMPVSITDDLKVIRIGSDIFSKDENDVFHLITQLESEFTYVDDIASRDHHFAHTTRRDMAYEDLYEQNEPTIEEVTTDYAESLARELEKAIVIDEATETSDNTTPQESDASQTNKSPDTSNTSVSSANEEESETEEAEVEEENKKSGGAEGAESKSDVSESEADGSDADDESEDLYDNDKLFESDTESSGNSAETSWSDGSSDELSDEYEDEDQWNDWGNEKLTFEELELDAAEKDSVIYMSGSDVDEQERLDEEIKRLNEDLESMLSEDDEDDETKLEVESDVDTSSGSESGKESILSHYTMSNYSDSEDGGDESEFETSEEAKQLEAMILGKEDSDDEERRRTSIEIFDISRPDPTPIFHFTRFVRGRIFNSPPAFHPSKSLLVWPLGDGELLFADYKANTYFTRRLTCSRFRSCHVFIRTHFSRNSEYIHFAALEAQQRDTEGDNAAEYPLFVSLQVSTHRLSVRKTTRCPPRLVYKTTIDLGGCDSLNVSRLPYSLHWTENELFLTTRGQTLDVIRVPLFHAPEETKKSVCYIQSHVFLPRTVESRTVHFVPPLDGSGGKKKSKQAMVIIGSHSSIPSHGLLVPRYQVCPPMGVLLHEEKDLGGWKCKPVSEGGATQRLNNAGGRLQGKFETFDRNEDCDIVPFLY
jgi:hypothetical protein